MATSTAARNTLADAFRTAASGSWKYIQLHTGNPGTTGANPSTVGRQATTWAAASGGSITGSQVTFTMNGDTISYIGVWDAASGGNFITGIALGASTTPGSGNQLLVTPTYTQN
uniref:phage tail fiber protein n=1 Tax=Tsukamurella tyrosinosolvens TaxID=57704 RepID=UPI003F58C6D4